jgi:hypothetical protein
MIRFKSKLLDQDIPEFDSVLWSAPPHIQNPPRQVQLTSLGRNRLILIAAFVFGAIFIPVVFIFLGNEIQGLDQKMIVPIVAIIAFVEISLAGLFWSNLKKITTKWETQSDSTWMS